MCWTCWYDHCLSCRIQRYRRITAIHFLFDCVDAVLRLTKKKEYICVYTIVTFSSFRRNNVRHCVLLCDWVCWSSNGWMADTSHAWLISFLLLPFSLDLRQQQQKEGKKMLMSGKKKRKKKNGTFWSITITPTVRIGLRMNMPTQKIAPWWNRNNVLYHQFLSLRYITRSLPCAYIKKICIVRKNNRMKKADQSSS